MRFRKKNRVDLSQPAEVSLSELAENYNLNRKRHRRKMWAWGAGLSVAASAGFMLILSQSGVTDIQTIAFSLLMGPIVPLFVTGNMDAPRSAYALRRDFCESAGVPVATRWLLDADLVPGRELASFHHELSDGRRGTARIVCDDSGAPQLLFSEESAAVIMVSAADERKAIAA